jgi:uncharacterized protein (DUF1330 family)
MSVYFFASIRINDDLEYEKYLDAADDIFSKYKGSYLAVDGKPEVLEGEWDYSRAVLISFETREDFHAWYRSDEYRGILQHRLSASECDTILIQGK